MVRTQRGLRPDCYTPLLAGRFFLVRIVPPVPARILTLLVACASFSSLLHFFLTLHFFVSVFVFTCLFVCFVLNVINCYCTFATNKDNNALQMINVLNSFCESNFCWHNFSFASHFCRSRGNCLPVAVPLVTPLLSTSCVFVGGNEH